MRPNLSYLSSCFPVKSIYLYSNLFTYLSFQREYLVDGPDSIRLEHGLTCLAWNDNPFEPAKIAVGGFSRRAVTLTFSDSGMNEECVLGEQHGNPVHDIAWAPSMGRSYHLIATASREPFIRVR